MVSRRRNKPKFLISACLAGVNCTYNAKNNLHPDVRKIFLSGDCLLVCPEVMGGLPVPRPPVEITGSRVVDIFGKDVTRECKRGVSIALRLTDKYGIKKAILKARSPSCGKAEIYDGTFSGVLKKGNGLLARALIRKGIKVYSEKDLKTHSLRW